MKEKRGATPKTEGKLLEGQLNWFDMLEAQNAEKVVRRITYEETKPFLLNIHYARRMPCITDAFGLFVNGELVGVVTYGVPASRPLCIGLAGVENEKNVRELNRLCIRPDLNGGGRNYASFLVSHSLKMLPNGTFVLSYADTAWTHVGYIYQACNFLYTGMSAKRKDTYQPGGLHPRAYDKNNHSDKFQTRSQKHRYVYLVGDKRTRRRMRQQLKYPVYDRYPKGDEQQYDTENPQIVHPVEIVERVK